MPTLLACRLAGIHARSILLTVLLRLQESCDAAGTRYAIVLADGVHLHNLGLA